MKEFSICKVFEKSEFKKNFVKFVKAKYPRGTFSFVGFSFARTQKNIDKTCLTISINKSAPPDFVKESREYKTIASTEVNVSEYLKNYKLAIYLDELSDLLTEFLGFTPESFAFRDNKVIFYNASKKIERKKDEIYELIEAGLHLSDSQHEKTYLKLIAQKLNIEIGSGED